MKNKAITSRNEDFAQWYTDIVRTAKLAKYSNVKGFIVMEPNGYAIWEKMQSVLDKKFKKTGHKNVAMPLLIPEQLLQKEAELIEGFAPEGAWVTHGGTSKLEERLLIRPTSETVFSDYFSQTLKSYRDLPVKLNQWCSVVRWEKETRPFLRGREFWWQEGHTIHETSEEAKSEVFQMLNLYKDFFKNYLAIPAVTGRKTEKEKFAGADFSYTIEALMYNGVSLQSGTSHYFGQKFSKAYDIKYLNRNNEYEHAYQTSWGCSTRMIGALIMVHSDDNGLILPPKIAPTQVVIVPIGKDEKVFRKAESILLELEKHNITAFIDNSENSPGFKFAEHEVNGIPVRVEIGLRDLENNVATLARRDTREKTTVSLNENIGLEVSKLLDDIQENLYNRALARQNELTFEATNLEEVEKIITTQPGFIKAMWCGSEECELKMKEINGIKSRCIMENHEHIHSNCVVCGAKAKELVLWGIQY